jgi:hypothetical protein
MYQGGLPSHGMSQCRPTHGRADLALLQRGLRVLAIAQRGKHDLRAGCRRREDRVESGVASGTGNRLPLGVTWRKNERARQDPNPRPAAEKAHLNRRWMPLGIAPYGI